MRGYFCIVFIDFMVKGKKGSDDFFFEIIKSIALFVVNIKKSNKIPKMIPFYYLQ